MNYEQLFAFVVFAEHLSFTHAAKQLHLSQPALHVQIKKLGEAVGCPLYRRTGRTLVLTPEGKQLAAFGREARDRGRAALEEIRRQPSSGPVVLASGQGAFLYLLGPAIRRFPKDRWPLRLLAMSGQDALEAVRDGRAHLGVVALDPPPGDLQAAPLRAVGQHVVLPASHRLARRHTLSVADLADEPLIVAPLGAPHRAMLAHLFHAARCALRVAVEATGWELMLRFAKSGMGLAVVNDFCAAPRGMIGIPLAGAPSITYYQVQRAGVTSVGSAALQRLITETAHA